MPRVTNIHLSPSALMNEVTRHNKGFLWVHTAPVLSYSEQIQQNDKMPFIVCDHSDTYKFTKSLKKRGGAGEAWYCRPLYRLNLLVRAIFFCKFTLRLVRGGGCVSIVDGLSTIYYISTEVGCFGIFVDGIFILVSTIYYIDIL